MGLFEDPRHPDEEKLKQRLYSPFSRAQTLKLAEESVVLLKNNGILPLKKSELKKVAVIGPNADNHVHQLGDWSAIQARELVATILDGVKEAFPNVEYQKGCGIDAGETGNLTAAIEAVKSSDISIVVIGDRHHYYGEGKCTGSLLLRGGQIELLNAIVETKKPFIIVLLSQKPLIIPENAREAASAILVQFCPGMEGGRALARVVFGAVNPSGRLTISMPSHVGQQPCYYYPIRYSHGAYADWPRQPLWPFGYGLGYSRIDYVDAKLDKNLYYYRENIHVTVVVKNLGEYDADEIVQLYVADLVTSVTWPQHQLKGFKRVHVKAHDSVTVEIVVPVSDCWLINKEEKRVVEPGAFEMRVGKASNDIKYKLAFSVA
jgi:beta-glucosidase